MPRWDGAMAATRSAVWGGGCHERNGGGQPKFAVWMVLGVEGSKWRRGSGRREEEREPGLHRRWQNHATRATCALAKPPPAQADDRERSDLPGTGVAASQLPRSLLLEGVYASGYVLCTCCVLTHCSLYPKTQTLLCILVLLV